MNKISNFLDGANETRLNRIKESIEKIDMKTHVHSLKRDTDTMQHICICGYKRPYSESVVLTSISDESRTYGIY